MLTINTDLKENKCYGNNEQITTDYYRQLASYINHAYSHDHMLDINTFLICMNTLNVLGSYNKLYSKIYRYLFNVSKSKMIEMIREAKNRYLSQHIDKKE
jgi:hypothetical protein